MTFILGSSGLNGSRNCDDADLLFPRPPALGMVVGTFAAVPYVHLQLEARRRYYPHVPLLVHDDGSHRRQDLSDLCSAYAADFEYNPERLPHHLGDVSAFVSGLQWAHARGVELLLKVSRRFLFRDDWTGSLTALAMDSQQATYSNHTVTFGLGFRSECVGLAVRLWASPAFYSDALAKISARDHVFVEQFIHHHGIALNSLAGNRAKQWAEARKLPPGRDGYADWDLIGTDRCRPPKGAGYLWHDSHLPGDYWRLAADWGLPYFERDFLDPNDGAGLGASPRAKALEKVSAWRGLEQVYRTFLLPVGPIRTIVDVGVDYGYSLFTFASDFPDAQVIGVDHFGCYRHHHHPDNEEFVRAAARSFPNVEILKMQSIDAAARTTGPIDMVHIDADHEYDAVRTDFEAWAPKVRSGGCVLFHDVCAVSDVARFFAELPGPKDSISDGCGLGCWYKR